MKIDLSLTAPENCPSFEICQNNNCPLEQKPNSYLTLPEDKLVLGWRRCKCSKMVRMRIAKAFELKNMGLTPRELSGMSKSSALKKQIFLQREKDLKSSKNGILEVGE